MLHLCTSCWYAMAHQNEHAAEKKNVNPFDSWKYKDNFWLICSKLKSIVGYC